MQYKKLFKRFCVSVKGQWWIEDFKGVRQNFMRSLNGQLLLETFGFLFIWRLLLIGRSGLGKFVVGLNVN